MGGEAGFGAGAGVVTCRLADFTMKEVVESDRLVVGVSRVDQKSSAAIQGRVADLALKLCSMPLRPVCYQRPGGSHY